MTTMTLAAPMMKTSTPQIEDATVLSAEIVAMFHDEVREVAHVRAPKPGRTAAFSIGSSLGVDFHVMAPELAGRAMPLVRATETGFVLTFFATFAGEATLEGVTEKLANLASTGRARPSAEIPGAFELPLVLGLKVSIDIGDVRLIVSGVHAPRRQPVALFAGFDKGLAKYVAGAAAACAMMLGLMSAIPPANHSLSLDKLNKPSVSAELNMKAEDAAELLVEKTTSEGGEGGKTEATKGGRAEGPEGRAGTLTSKNKQARISITDNGPDKGLAQNLAFNRGGASGIVGAIRTGGFQVIVTRGPMISSDYSKTNNPYGGVEGDFGDQYGWGGRGNDGPGWGGGGNSTDTMGTGDYKTITRGNGDTDKWQQPGDGKGDPRVKTVKRPPSRTDFGPVQTDSDLDREMIKREIRKQRPAFEFCYEKQLIASPSIEGTVNATFTILGNGTVRASVAKGVHSAVSSCVAGVISRIQFAKPSSGGSAQVSYPFIFRKTGE